MGTSLRKAAKLGKLGGHGVGWLTKMKAADLQMYYGRALRRNVGNVEATKDAMWATGHRYSTPCPPTTTHITRGAHMDQTVGVSSTSQLL